jgi:hypothetical protein
LRNVQSRISGIDNIDRLIERARVFETLGDHPQAVHFYQSLIGEMDDIDPRREPAPSSIEYRHALGTVWFGNLTRLEPANKYEWYTSKCSV